MRTRRRRSRLQLPLFPADALAATSAAVSPDAAPPAATVVEPPPQATISAGARSPVVAAPPPPRPQAPRRVTSAEARRMVWLRAQGASVTAIATQFQTSRQVVQRYLRDPQRIRALEEQEAQGRRDTKP